MSSLLHRSMFRVVGEREMLEMPNQESNHERTSEFGAFMNQAARHGERLASVERSVAGLTEDSRVMRAAMHEVNGKMQIFIIAEQACGAALKAIDETMRNHTSSIEKLMSARDQAYGVWWAIVRVCAVVVATGAALAAVVGLVGWMLEHHASINFN